MASWSWLRSAVLRHSGGGATAPHRTAMTKWANTIQFLVSDDTMLFGIKSSAAEGVDPWSLVLSPWSEVVGPWSKVLGPTTSKLRRKHPLCRKMTSRLNNGCLLISSPSESINALGLKIDTCAKDFI